MDYLKYLKYCPCGKQKYFSNCCKIQGHDEFSNIDHSKPDWRIAISVQIANDVPPAYPGGPSHPKGSYLSVSHFAKHPDHGLISFMTPHTSALYLSSSLKNAINATDEKRKLKLFDTVSPDGKAKMIDPYFTLFDYYEFSMISINFAFQAIEAYCNSILASFPTRKFQLNQKGKIKNLTRDEVERYCNIEEKLCVIMPELLEMKSPKGTSTWHNFTKLKKIRDGIVHIKSQDMYSHVNSSSDTLFFLLFDEYPLIFPKYAFEIIWYFYNNKIAKFSTPGWATEFLQYLGYELEKYY